MHNTMSIIDYIHRQRDWSQRTFGKGPRTLGLTRHIESELKEIKAAPHDVIEWVDVVILALDGAWRAGHTPEEIAKALDYKQKLNFARKWPIAPPPDKPSMHIKTAKVAL